MKIYRSVERGDVPARGWTFGASFAIVEPHLKAAGIRMAGKMTDLLTAIAKVRAKYPRFPDDLVRKYAHYLVACQRSDKNRDVLTGELVADLLARAPTWRAKLRVLSAIITTP